jgi:hypothetical protein
MPMPLKAAVFDADNPPPLLDQIEEAYDLIGNQREGVVKVGITP